MTKPKPKLKTTTNVVALAPRIEARDAARAAVFDELMEFADDVAFPGEQIIDQGTQEPTLTGESEARLRRIFELFGITDLNPLNPDFELVAETWYALFRVGSSLKSRQMFHGTLYKAQLGIWHPDYKA